MARGIYKNTMHRSSANKTEDTQTAKPSADGDPAGADSQGTNQRATSAQPLIGKRTLYVDRQVARRARSRSKTKQIRQLKILAAVLILGLIFTSMGWILAWARHQDEIDRRVAVNAELRKQEQELEQLRMDLEQRETDLLHLVENRIPGLEPIAYNKLIDINDKYVLNVAFSKAGTGTEKQLEYHAMLVNSSAQMVNPNVKIYIFNEFGLQVGIAKLEKEHATSNAALAELEPGETRSYSSHIEMERKAVPAYYMIYVE